MKTVLRIVIAALATLGVARAQDACKADVVKFCANIPPGGGRVLSCLKANEAKVSPECKAQIAAMKKKVKEVGKDCEDDLMKFCGTVEPGQGRLVKCLAANSGSLQPKCQEHVARAQEKMGEFKKACGEDAKKLCKGIPAGKGRILSCLESRKADLSPACQEFMK